MGMRTFTPMVAMYLVWLAWWLSWLAAAFWADRAVKRPPLRSELVYRALVIGGMVLLFDVSLAGKTVESPLWRTPHPAAWVLVGVAALGFAFTWWARVHLGRLWSSSVTRKAGHRVIDTGPYGIVRHPIYTGVILASAAAAALRPSAAAWAGFLVITAGWYVKARIEERFLRDELGHDAYGAYARRVPMLVPRPWRS